MFVYGNAFLFQFLLIFRKAMAGELSKDSGLFEVYRQMSEIDVDKEGVKGAKNFFEAKVGPDLFLRRYVYLLVNLVLIDQMIKHK